MSDNLIAKSPVSMRAVDLSELRSTLLGYCLTLTGSKWAAEDLVQDICLKALPVIQGVKPHENTKAYLFRAAKNQWIDQVRRHKVLDRKIAELQLELMLESSAQIDKDEVSTAVRLTIELLSPVQRCVFLLRDVLSYTSREVADKLNMTEGAVKSALYRARTALVSVELTQEELTRLDTFFSESEQAAAKLQLYLLAIRHEDAGLIVQMLNNDLAEADILINKLRSDSVQQQAPQKQAWATGRPSTGQNQIWSLSA